MKPGRQTIKLCGSALLAAIIAAAPGWAARSNETWIDKLHSKEPFVRDYGRITFHTFDAASKSSFGITPDKFLPDLKSPDQFDLLVESEGLSNSARRLKIAPNHKFQVRRNSQGLTIETTNGKLVTTIHRQSFDDVYYPSQIGDFCWSRDSRNLFYCTPTGVAIFNLKDKTTLNFPQQQNSYLCALSSDGKWLAACSDSNLNEPRVKLLRISASATGTPCAHISLPTATCMQWSPVEDKLAVSNGRRQILVLQGKKQFKADAINLPGFSTNAFAWSPDGLKLAIVKPYTAVHIYSLNGTPLKEFPIEGVTDVAWSAKGYQLICRVGHTLVTIKMDKIADTASSAPPAQSDNSLSSDAESSKPPESVLGAFPDGKDSVTLLKSPEQDPWKTQFSHEEISDHFRIYYQNQSEFTKNLQTSLENELKKFQETSPVDWNNPVSIFVLPSDFAVKQFLVHNQMPPQNQDSILFESRNAIVISENTPADTIRQLLNTYVLELTAPFNGNGTIDDTPSSWKWTADWEFSWPGASKYPSSKLHAVHSEKQALDNINLFEMAEAAKSSPDGQKRAAVLLNTLSYYDKTTKKARTIEVSPLATAIKAASPIRFDWSPDSKRIVIASENGCQIYDLQEQTSKRYRGFTSNVCHCAWSRAYDLIAATGKVDSFDENRCELQIFDPQDGTVKYREPHLNGALTWSPDGKTLAAAASGYIELLEKNPNWTSHKCKAFGCDTNSLAWSSDGKYFALIRPYYGLQIFSKEGKLLQKIQTAAIQGLSWNKTGDGLTYNSPLQGYGNNSPRAQAPSFWLNSKTIVPKKIGDAITKLNYPEATFDSPDFLPADSAQANQMLDNLLPSFIKQGIAQMETADEALQTFQKLKEAIGARLQLTEEVPLTNYFREKYKISKPQDIAELVFKAYWSHLSGQSFDMAAVCRQRLLANKQQKNLAAKSKVLPVSNQKQATGFDYPIDLKLLFPPKETIQTK